MDAQLAHNARSQAAHSLLNGLLGEWQGFQRTWFEPGVLADESPIRGRMISLLEGRFVRWEYDSMLQGQVFSGQALMGYYDLRQRFEVAWVDSFHMSSGILYSTGDLTGSGFSVQGTYPDGQGGPDWGWRTVLQVINAEQINLSAYNITPAGDAALALEAVLGRVG